MSNRRHFYTADPDEMGAALAEAGTEVEGVAGYVGDEALRASGGLPLYHFSNPATGAHLYTADAHEALAAEAEGYQYEGEAGYVFAPPPSQPEETARWLSFVLGPAGAAAAPEGAVPLYHLHRAGSGDHLYLAGGEDERAAAQEDGYRLQGIAAYVYASPLPGTRPLYRLVRDSGPTPAEQGGISE